MKEKIDKVVEIEGASMEECYSVCAGQGLDEIKSFSRNLHKAIKSI